MDAKISPGKPNHRKPARKNPPPNWEASLSQSGITENELRFAREYCIDHNATRAYQRAYPNTSYATAATQGYRLLNKPRVSEEIKAAEKEHLRATSITARRVLRELAAIAFFDPGDIYESAADGSPTPRSWSTLSARARKVIQSIKVKRRNVDGGDGQKWILEEIDIRFHSKLDALGQLCKHLGLMSESTALGPLLDALAQREIARESPANELG